MLRQIISAGNPVTSLSVYKQTTSKVDILWTSLSVISCFAVSFSHFSYFTQIIRRDSNKNSVVSSILFNIAQFLILIQYASINIPDFINYLTMNSKYLFAQIQMMITLFLFWYSSLPIIFYGSFFNFKATKSHKNDKKFMDVVLPIGMFTLYTSIMLCLTIYFVIYGYQHISAYMIYILGITPCILYIIQGVLDSFLINTLKDRSSFLIIPLVALIIGNTILLIELLLNHSHIWLVKIPIIISILTKSCVLATCFYHKYHARNLAPAPLIAEESSDDEFTDSNNEAPKQAI